MSQIATSPKANGDGLQDHLLEPVDKLSELMAKRRQADLKALKNMALQRDEVLFDGQWLSVNDAKRRHSKMRWKSWLTILELILALVILVMMAGLILGVLSMVGGVILPSS